MDELIIGFINNVDDYYTVIHIIVNKSMCYVVMLYYFKLRIHDTIRLLI